ncbi:MAG: bifunctional sugar-1-phosphate nucleotidylyltransferase/acetyltransferase, partial [Patescibacteria group bacterium]
MKKQFKTEQAVILAAGLGLRFRPLTETKPKPLLKVLDKSILEHNLDQLDGLVKEVILVVGYLEKLIKKTLGNKYKSLRIKYIFQKKPLGTADAAKKTFPFLKEKFLLLNGDDIYDAEDIKKCLVKYPSILLAHTENSSNFGVVSCSQNLVKGIVEKPKEAFDNLVNTGLYFLPKSIFSFKIKKSPRGEYEFTDYINEFIKKEKLFFVVAKKWYPLPYPWYFFKTNEFLIKKDKRINKGRIEKNCVLKGKIIVEKGAIVKSGSYLQGPVYIGQNSEVGPNVFLRGPLSIGAGCRIGQAVEVKNSIIGDNSKIAHLSFVGDSIIGDNCNLGAGVILSNLRFDRKTIKTTIAGKEIDTKKEKFGAILGDNVQVGVNSTLMPGVNIG